MSAPQSFYCPITLEIMTDPVCDKEGNTFERTAITDWIQIHSSSPITRTPMTLSDLIPNRSLKDMISQYYKKKSEPKQDAISTSSEHGHEDDDVIQVNSFVQDSKVLVSINPGDSQCRTFINVVCVIDVSGSMGTSAPVPGDTSNESNGLIILDVVKHAVKTIIKSLSLNDTLSIVTFSGSAHIVLPLTEMNTAGQTAAITALEALQPTNSTNIWAGLEKGLDVLITASDVTGSGRFSTLLLFTDGEPTDIPPRGHLPMLQMYKDQHGGSLPGTINTFGFGYILDSGLLNELAIEGQGLYAFIPDSGMVGTIFVHAIANLKTTIATNCRLQIEPLNGAKFVDPSMLGKYLLASESWGLTIDIGCLQTGQTKDLALEMSNLPSSGTEFMSITLTAKTRKHENFKLSSIQTCPSEAEETSIEQIIPKSSTHFNLIQATKNALNSMMSGSAEENTEGQVIPAYNRFRFVQLLKDIIVSMNINETKTATIMVKKFIQDMKQDKTCKGPQTTGLIQDLEGQVLESLDPTYYKKWGRHYLPSLSNAHLYQVCNNFKDHGPQFYGGTLFQKLRDEADTLFCSLPPPKPSRKATRAVDMRQYHNRGGGCIHGQCIVSMADGTKKTAEAIKKGDQVSTLNGLKATIVCVVRTTVSEKIIDLVECPNGLLATPWHPIRLVQDSGEWVFPNTLTDPKAMSCEFVYNFVLDQGHTMIINDVEVVTLGHSFTDSVCAHEYFGTNQVINDLKLMAGYDAGLVRIGGVIRNPFTSKIGGLIIEE